MNASLKQDINRLFSLHPCHFLKENFLKIDEVFAIVFYGRSGSVFLQSLFDNHPHVLMLPGTFLMKYFNFWELYGHLLKQELICRFTGYFAPFFDIYSDAENGQWAHPAIELSFDCMGEDRNESLGIKKNEFTEIMMILLEKIDKCSRRVFFQAIHVAYSISLRRASNLDLTRLPIIIYQSHTPYNSIDLLLNDFPKLKIIHSVREPLQTLGSHFKHHLKAYVLRRSYGDAFPFLGPQRSRAVKLEDLHINPKIVLEKLCAWMGLSWADSLLESTFDGKKWWNLRDSTQISGFNKLIISKNHDDVFFKIDKYRLRVLYWKRYKYWNYENKKNNFLEKLILLPLLLLPFKIELLCWKKEYQEKKFLDFLISTVLEWWYTRRLFIRGALLYCLSLNRQIREVELI